MAGHLFQKDDTKAAAASDTPLAQAKVRFHGPGRVAERFKAPVLKFVFGRAALFCSVIEYIENKRHFGFWPFCRIALSCLVLPSWVAKW
jgi:hypothetical protein